MRLGFKFIYTLLLFSLIHSNNGLSQQPVQQLDPEASWLRAMDLWNKEKYAASQKYFNEVAAYYENTSDPRLADCHFYSAYCALKLYNKDAEFQFRRFLELHPEDPRDDLCYFFLGKYNFERKRYPNTLEWFKKLEVERLPENLISDYYYYNGYSNFKTDELKEAQLSFTHNLQEGDPFYHPAVYYTAYIDYVNEHYQLALDGFLKLTEEDGFSEMVPYYIAQIYFLQERYAELIAYAEPWISKVSTKRKGEMSRLLAESYFHEGDYQKALSFYEIYFEMPHNVSRDDFYAYGYSLYKAERYNDAINQLNRVINEADALTQVALLNMGDCYLKLEKYKNAQNAFKNASAFDYDPRIKEEAFFNYAKLSYKLSFDPFDEAIQAFEKYLDTYPHSDKKDEAYIFLLNVYMRTKNYQSALAVIDKIKYPDYKVKSAYQLAVYNIGVEYYQQKKYDDALRSFQNVSKYDFEKLTVAESYFWQGELKFKKKNFRGAVDSYAEFISASNAYQSPYFSRAYYGQAYSQLKLKAYSKALENFHQFIHFDKGKNVKLNADAEQRIGDIYFLQKKYDMAINYFTSASSKSEFDKDYALYQIAMAQGYMLDQSSKVNTLSELISDMPESVYRAKAMFEKGNTYFEMENYQMALESLKELEESYPNSKLIASSYLKKGLIYLKMQNNAASKEAFLYVFNTYPNSKAANEALISMKEVDLATFTKLAKQTGYADVSEEDVDAANFEEAEEAYIDGKYERAAFLLGHYLNGFPNGKFRQNAHFYKADCHVRNEELDSALVQFEHLLERPGNPYYENALYMSSSICKSLELNEKAYRYSQLLFQSSENKQYRNEALDYLIVEGFVQGEFIKVISWAKMIRSDEKRQVSEKQFALLQQINSHIELDEKSAAEQLITEADFELRDASTAELAYKKAEWIYDKGDFKKAEEELYFLLQNFGSFGEWRARGFILLGDVYVGLEDPFQAKATWQSVIDHHKGADLVKVAQNKLDELIAREDAENQRELEEEEIDYNKDIQSIENQADTSLSNQNEVLETDTIKGNER